MEVEITSDAGTKRPAATGDSNPRPKKKPNSDSAPTQTEEKPASPPGDDLERLKITIRTLIIESAQTQQDLQNAEEEVIRLRQENETLRFITADHHIEAIPPTTISSENEKNGQEEEGRNGEGGETVEVRRHCPAPACPEHSEKERYEDAKEFFEGLSFEKSDFDSLGFHTLGIKLMDFLIKKQNYLQWHAASLTAEVIPYRPETVIHWYTSWKKSGVIEGSHHPRGKHTLLDTDPEFKTRAFDFCKKTVLANEKGLTEKVFFNFLQNQPEAAHFKRHGTHSTSRHYLHRLGFTPVYCYQTKSVSWCPAPWHKDSHHQIHVKHEKKESPPATSPAPSSSA